MYAILDSLGIADYELVALGSTPKRLRALLAGECAATMLNAGNELHAEAAGFRVLGRAPQPYLGTVLVARTEPPGLAAALTGTAAAIVAGELDDVVTAEAESALDLPPELARRYLERLRSPTEGLVPDGVADPAAMATIARLRATYRP
jgi:hypothetical protein